MQQGIVGHDSCQFMPQKFHRRKGKLIINGTSKTLKFNMHIVNHLLCEIFKGGDL